MPQAGEKAPDFELPDQEGRAVRLSDFRGKKVVLFAYPKADTPGCTRQACGFRDSYARVQSAGAVVLGLSPDRPAALKKWQAKQSLPFTLLSDPDHGVLEAWGAWGEKTLYGKTSAGVLRSHWVIDEEGRVVDAQVKVTPEQSVERALQALGVQPAAT